MPTPAAKTSPLVQTAATIPLVGAIPAANASRTPKDPVQEQINAFDQKIALGQAVDNSNLTMAEKSALGLGTSSAAASALRQQTEALSTLRDNLAGQQTTSSPISGVGNFEAAGQLDGAARATQQAPSATPVAPAKQAAPSLMTPVDELLPSRSGVPAFADGGVVDPVEALLARTKANYGVGNASTPEPAPQAAPAAPSPAAPPAKPKTTLGGVMGLLSNRKAQIDKAVDGYATGGVVNPDPTYAEQLRQATLGNAGGADPATAPRVAAETANADRAAFDAEVRSRVPETKYSAMPKPTAPVEPTYAEQLNQARLGKAGAVPPEAIARQKLAEEAATLARNDAEVRARIPAKAAPAPASPATPAAPAANAPAPSAPSSASAPSAPAVESAPSNPTAAPKAAPAGNPRMGGVPGSDRWTTTGGMQGPGNTPADTAAAAGDAKANAQFAEDVKARTGARPQASAKPDFVFENMDGKGPQAAESVEAGRAKADAMRNGKAAGNAAPKAAAAAEAEAAAKTAATTAAEAAPKGVMAKAASGAKSLLSPTNIIKGGVVAAPAIGAVESVMASPEKIKNFADSLGVDDSTNGGHLVARTADFLKNTGNAATLGLATPVGEALSDAFNDPKYEKRYGNGVIGGVQKIGAALSDKVSGWWNKPREVEPVKPAVTPTTEPATPPAGGATPPAQAAPQAPDARFTPDADQNKPLPPGTVRMGPATGAVSGRSNGQADQMTPPVGGGYATDATGRAIFVPGQKTAERDPNARYDAYGNNMAATDQMNRELRAKQRAGYEADLQSALPFYQARGARGLAALNNDPEAAADRATEAADTLAKNVAAQDERKAASTVDGIAARELADLLKTVTDPAKRQELIDAATASKGRYVLAKRESLAADNVTKLVDEAIYDTKRGRWVDQPGGPSGKQPTPAHVDTLRKYPDASHAKEFDKIYGAGAAARVLGTPAKFAHGGRIGGVNCFAKGGCVGKYAKGGEVIEGAGNGTSDSVPAHVAETGQPIRVSAGEYELSPEVVAKVGVDKLNTLLDKYHQGESRAVPQGSFIVPADVVKRLGRAYFDHMAKA